MNLHEAIDRARAFAERRGIALGERVCGYPDGTKYDPYWELFFEIPGGPADWAWVVWVYKKNSHMEKRPYDWPSDWTQREEWSEPRNPRMSEDQDDPANRWEEPKRRFQFSLRKLTLFITWLCILLAVEKWVEQYDVPVPLPLIALPVVVAMWLSDYLLTRWSGESPRKRD